MVLVEVDVVLVVKVLVGVSGELQVLLLIEGFVDFDVFKGCLEKDIVKVEKEIKGLVGWLGNFNFVDKVLLEVVVECQVNFDEKYVQVELVCKCLVDLS